MIRINESPFSTTISKAVGHRLIVADLSLMDRGSALGYLQLSENLDNKIVEIMDSAEHIYFFNRLNVPEPLRGNKYGQEMLEQVLDYCEKKGIFLVNHVSNSGQMGQDNLMNFYIKNGMTLVNEDGLLVYHSTLNPSSLKKPKI